MLAVKINMDADQLREARRRRILENSERRLQKILGLSENKRIRRHKFINIACFLKFFNLLEPEVNQDDKNPPGSGPILEDLSVTTKETGPETEIKVVDSVLRQRIPTAEVTDQSTHHIARTPQTQAIIDPPTNLAEDGSEADQHHYMLIILSFLAAASISLLSSGFGILIGNVRVFKFYVTINKFISFHL